MKRAGSRRASGEAGGRRSPRREALLGSLAVLGVGIIGLVGACQPRTTGLAAGGREPLPSVAGAPADQQRDGRGGLHPSGGRAVPAPDGPSVRRLDPCLPVDYEVCFNALDDNCNGALEEGCGVPAGVVQFMAGWEALRADVDLNVTDPSGELIEAGRAARSGLIKTRDCPGRRQECSGVNLENVFLEGNKAPTRGRYRVSVALESLGVEQPPIWVNLSVRLGVERHAFEVRLQAPEDERHVELEL